MADIKFIVFDLDGTLLDSAAAYIAGVQAAVEELGLPRPKASMIRETIGKLPLPETLEHLGLSSNNIQAALDHYHKLRPKFSNMIRMYPGVIEILLELNTKDIRCAVLTMKDQASADYRVDQFHLRKFFVDVVGTPNLSKTESLRYLLLKHNVTPQEAIMIGDGIADVSAGKEVGTWTIAITSGYHQIDQLAEKNPDFCAETVQDVLICINKILKENLVKLTKK
ncbi:MAG: HAD family hydrolase [Candidatus Hodarchaeota archaeon]